MQVGLDEWVGERPDPFKGLFDRCPRVSEDRRVKSIIEVRSVACRVDANPVVVDGLIGFENEGVTLSRVYWNRVDSQRFCKLSVGFDDREGVVVDGENVIWFTRHTEESDAVSFPFHDVDYG